MNKVQRRFWDKVDMFGSYGCWEWQAADRGNGYGAFKVNDKTVSAHRFAWENTNGSIPESMCVLHICDNRKCVNPNHLYLGTKADNVRDMWERGNPFIPYHRGGEIGNSKLTKDDVLTIRQRYKNEDVSLRELAKDYLVCHQHIGDIVNRKVWTHI